ncbi:MAG: Clp protease ClpP [Clostridium sp.]|nr:Clp protease ClpP [Clostridium sp.]
MKNKFWNFVKNEETPETELIFNGPISDETWWGDEITPALFRDELSKVSGNLTVWLNSPGGDVFAASQIYTMLCNHKGKVTVKIDGLAASAASVVAMAGDETLISPTGMIMCHNPATCAMGNKSDMEKAIELLEEVKESIINAYARKTGLSRNKISRLMDEETWMNAEKALQLGFVDGILFDEKSKKEPIVPEEDDPDEEPEEEKPDEDTPDEDAPDEEQEKKKQQATMMYSPLKTTASFMQKISASAPMKGVPIDQLNKRLELLKK